MNHNKTVTDLLHLTAYKRFVRHLKAVHVKNLSYRAAEVTKLLVFFTLHTGPDAEEFYKSEPLTATINPSWESFDLSNIESSYTATAHTVLRVWIQEGNCDPLIHLEYDLDLHALQTKPAAMEASPVRTKDFLTVSLFNTTFQIPEVDTPVDLYACYNVHSSATKSSYSLNLLARLQTVLRALKQTQQSVRRVRLDIESRLQQVEEATNKQEEVELSETKLLPLIDRLRRTEAAASLKKTQLYSRRAETKKIEKEAAMFNKLIMEEDEHFGEVKSDRNDKKGRLLRSASLLFRRQRQLVHELCVIYPIEQIEGNRYMIGGVYLPNSDLFSGQSDEPLSTAFGFCSHLVDMLSHVLDLPLQYPLECKGSRSRVRDFIVENASVREKGFPLHSRGKEKNLFRYAVFLLNKNIAQLRYAYGLSTQDLRHTLRNLNDFLVNKFGVVSPTRMIPRPAISAPPAPLLTESTSSPTQQVSARAADYTDAQADADTRAEESSGSSNDENIEVQIPNRTSVNNSLVENGVESKANHD